MITENLATLKINKLSKKQYNNARNNGQLDTSALYLTTEQDVVFKNFSGEEDLKTKLIEVAQSLLDTDSYEQTIYLTDDTREVFEFGTAIAKMYRHDEESQGDLFKYFPVQIFCESAVYNGVIWQDEVKDWGHNGPDRVLTENYLRTLLGTAEGGTF